MATGRNTTSLQGLHTLFEGGTAVGQPDRQLLERFARRDGEPSERAFAALVDRHGGMVARTCRAVLRNEHDAQDAFQATFLLLAREADRLWVRDSLGPWLHRVACRTARRASRRAERCRVAERRAAERAPLAVQDRGHDGLASALHEEVERLPERYRAPIVLCDLQGRSYEEAARQAGCPIGTIRSRLARGRARLRDRLVRRGLAPAAGASLTMAEPAPAAVPADLARRTVAAAMRSAATPAAVGGGVLAIGRLGPWRAASLVVLSAGMALGALANGARSGSERAQPAPAGDEKQGAGAPDEPRVAYSWQRIEGYEPPDFDRFFPDDPAGGRALDVLWNDPLRDKRPDAEILHTVRRGLRRTSASRSEVLEWFGSRYVWFASPQNAEAIEILYHAADFRGDRADPYGARSAAVRHGLAMVQPKPPAVLRTLVELSLRVDAYDDWQSIAWGTRPQRRELLARLQPYCADPDPAVRQKAELLAAIFRNRPDAYIALEEWNRKQVRARCGPRLPAVRQALADGNSAARREALAQVQSERMYLLMDRSFAAALRACSNDPEPAVRLAFGNVAFVMPWLDPALRAEVVDVLPRLIDDGDSGVRKASLQWARQFLHGVSPTPPRSLRRQVVERLVERAVVDDDAGKHQQVAWAVSYDRDLAAECLDAIVHGPDAARAARGREIYKAVAGRTAPGETIGPEVRARYANAVRDLHAYLRRVYPYFRVKGIDWEQVGRALLPRAGTLATEEEFRALVWELLARLEDSNATWRAPAPDQLEWVPGPTCLIDDRGRPVLYDADWWSVFTNQGPRPGMAVVAVNGVPADVVLTRWMGQQRRYRGYSSERLLRSDAGRQFLRQRERGAKVTLVVEDTEGRRHTANLTADLHCQRCWVPRAPVSTQGVDENGAEVSWFLRTDGIGHISIRVIRDLFEVDLGQALASLATAKGIIIDLRGNQGSELEGDRAFDPAHAFAGLDRASNETGHIRYRGPVALLIDEQTRGDGEEAAAWFAARQRARLFGATTAGAARGKLAAYPLGDDLGSVIVPVKAHISALGWSLERRGVVPDVAVPYRAQDLARGRDTVAEAAAAWLARQ